MQMRSLLRFARAADGTDIAWREVGAGEPLLLISGQAVDSRAWDAVVPELSQCFRVITFDYRGIGDSAAGADDSYSTRHFARDAVAVIDAAGVKRAHVYGHSMGGRVAQWIALDSAPRVASLVLGATTAGDARGASRSAQTSADLASGDPDRLARLFFRSGERRADGAAFFDHRSTHRARRLHFAASLSHDTWDRLADIAAPTLVIHGSADEMTPPGNAERMAAAIPRAQLVLIEGARHGYYLEEPEATRVVVDFLRNHPAGDPVAAEPGSR
jgi:pimeloyl-ACP methyl ester carboxylesterase